MRDLVAFLAVLLLVGCATDSTERSETALPTPSTSLDSPSVLPTKTTNRPVLVDGEVLKPGPVVWERDLTVRSAIAAAGGFTRFADLGHIEVRHSDNGQTRYSLEELLSAGTNAPTLKPGDKVHVERRSTK